MKVWISKLALTKGIYEAEVAVSESGYVSETSTWGFGGRLGRDAHETREAAVAAAEQMRLKKIASLKKQLTKLEAMKF